jgi:hypothetical protein
MPTLVIMSIKPQLPIFKPITVPTSWIRIRVWNADPDPRGHQIRIQCGSGSEIPVLIAGNASFMLCS